MDYLSIAGLGMTVFGLGIVLVSSFVGLGLDVRDRVRKNSQGPRHPM